MSKRNSFLLVLAIVLAISIGGHAQAPDLQKQIYQARDRVLPALVNVEPVKSLFSTGEKTHTLVTGSGIIISPEGYIITNNHVVENAEKVWCTLFNRKRVTAEIVGTDPETDIAVLKMDPAKVAPDTLPYARLGNSDSLQVGEIVLALGSPLGFSQSVSMGVISSINRYFEDSGDMVSPYNLWIQTDAAINPGNSGGPLINLEGEVVGINARGIFLAENLGFAIPINLAREIAEKFIHGTPLERSWLGLNFHPIKPLREYLGLDRFQGVLIANVEPFSPARKAGILPGDVLQRINDRPVNADFEEDLPTVRKIVADLPIGSPVNLTIWRQGKTLRFSLRPQPEPFRRFPEFECRQWGVVVKNISKQIFRFTGVPDPHGVYVSAIKRGEPADIAGLRVGDIIRKINGTPVKDLLAFKERYQQLSNSTEPVYLEAYRQGGTYFFLLTLNHNFPDQ